MSIPQPLDLFTPIASNFIPQAQILTNVTNAVNAECSTQDDHGYATGMFIRMIVPPVYGMSLPYVQTQIVVTGSTTFTTAIDTSAQLPFVTPVFNGTNPFTLAQCVPIDGITWNIAPTQGLVPPPKLPGPMSPPPDYSASGTLPPMEV